MLFKVNYRNLFVVKVTNGRQVHSIGLCLFKHPIIAHKSKVIRCGVHNN